MKKTKKDSRSLRVTIITTIVTALIALLGIYIGITPDFTVSINPMSGQAYAGGNIQATVSISSNLKYGENVELTVTERPDDFVITLMPDKNASGSYETTMTVAVGENVEPDDYEIKINARGADGKEHSCLYSLTVKPSTQAVNNTASQVRITYPGENSKVGLQQEVGGTADNIADDKTVHIIVYSYGSKRYYPQGAPDIRENGDWSKTVYFGNEQDKVKKYRLIAVVAEESADTILKNYMIESESDKSYPGYASLFEGCEIMDTVEVTR